jgi:hypothetical protein
MPMLARFAAVVSAAALAGSSAGVASAAGSSPPDRAAARSPHWIKISSDIGFGFASAGMLRTSDGRLHVLWPTDISNDHTLNYSTVSAAGKLLAAGVILRHWGAIDQVPSLVPDPQGHGRVGLRAVFNGENNKAGSPYNIGSFYSATAGPSGTHWTLEPGSLSHDNGPLTDNTATAKSDGEPVTAWSEVSALAYHVGIDPHVPARAPDIKIPVGASGGVLNPTLLTSHGVVWGAWFNSSGTATMGYWVDKIFSGAPGMRKAPGSGGRNLNNSQPEQPVALAARTRGGIYLAYCAPTRILTCGHVALWRAGAARAMSVPGSASGNAGKVALAAAPGGYLWVLWFDFHSNVIHAVRTNAAATAFGPVRTIRPPAQLDSFSGLEANASLGPLSIVALAQTGTSSSPAYYFAQIRS